MHKKPRAPRITKKDLIDQCIVLKDLVVQLDGKNKALEESNTALIESKEALEESNIALVQKTQSLETDNLAIKNNTIVDAFKKVDRATLKSKIEEVEDPAVKELMEKLFKVTMALCWDEYDIVVPK